MPTNKPRVQTILDEDLYKKFKELAEREQRTESAMAKWIITKYIKEEENKQMDSYRLVAEAIPEITKKHL